MLKGSSTQSTAIGQKLTKPMIQAMSPVISRVDLGTFREAS
jgi:hypothetical protein